MVILDTRKFSVTEAYCQGAEFRLTEALLINDVVQSLLEPDMEA